MAQEVLETDRLYLRPIRIEDAPYIVDYAGNRLISDNASRIPHPYTLDDAKQFLKMADDGRVTGTELIFGIILKSEGHVIGCVGLIINKENDSAEMGFWVGHPFWGRGYCTEAAKRLLDHGFRNLSLNCVFATHFPHNIGSCRIIQKLGMTCEGTLRQRERKGENYLDLVMNSILKSEYL